MFIILIVGESNCMQNRFERTHKIDLTISRKAKSALSQSVNTQHIGKGDFTKKQRKTYKKMIELTISRIIPQKQQIIFPKNDSIHSKEVDLVLSHLILSHKDSQAIVAESKTTLNSVQEIQNQDVDRLQEYLRYNQNDSKIELIEQLLKTQKKIDYFNDLLKQNSLKFKTQMNERVNKYQSYLSKLKQFYGQELSQMQKLNQVTKMIMDKSNEDDYYLLRTKINRQGQRGLNFTPKRLSVFSGVQEALLLSDGSDILQEEQVKNELFNFGLNVNIKTNGYNHIKRGVHQASKQNFTHQNVNKMAFTLR